MEHRLRAMPFYARNVGLVASAAHVWVGLVILFTPEYLDDFGATDAATTSTVTRSVPYGVEMLLLSIFGGGAMLAFECATFTRRGDALVMAWLWPLRVFLYALLAVPGYYAAATTSYMPGLLGSVYYTMAAALNAAACAATRPTAKQWDWKVSSRPRA